MKEVKRNIRNFAIVFAVSFIFILLNFGIHLYRTKVFNDAERSVSALADSPILIELNNKAYSSGSWEKSDSLEEGKSLYGNIYEATVTNTSGITIIDWTLRINITQDCYFSNAWSGAVEIHQNINGTEKIQTLDMSDFDPSNLVLDGTLNGSDLLIPLKAGDYIVYIPSEESFETPLASNKELSGFALFGFIFYSADDNPVNLSDYCLTYRFHKPFLSGTEVIIFSILLPLWFICLIFFILGSFFSISYEKRLENQDRVITESLEVFCNFVDAKDEYTYGHSERVSRYSRMIAQRLGMSDEEVKIIGYQAMLHDIGKVFIPDEILKKPSNLTPEEYEIIKSHPNHGANILKNFSSIPNIADGSLYHHERYDGSGYPNGLKGNEIPLSGRIISVADFYDAIRSDRSYKKHVSKEEALEELRKYRGSRFDPEVAKVFEELIQGDHFPEIYN